MNLCAKRVGTRIRDVNVMSISRIFFVLLILFVSASPNFVSMAIESESENIVALAIDRAEAIAASAYKAVLDAEKVGANVSDLLTRLNVGGEHLANAHVSYSLRDFSNATRFADLSYDVGEEVKNMAYERKNEAYSFWITDLVLRMVGSIISVIIVLFLCFLGWRAFKQRYRNRILGMKPGEGFG